MTVNLSDYFAGPDGQGVNGVTMQAYKASGFVSAPVLDTPLPGSPDATAVTASSVGGPGAFQLTLPTAEPYWVGVSYNGHVYWKLYPLPLALVPTTVKTGNYTAKPGDYVPCDTTTAALTVTLPTAPPDGTRIGVKIVTLGAGHSVTVHTGGSDVFNKAGGSTSATLSLLSQAQLYQYAAGPAIWYVTADDLPLSQLDARYEFALLPTATKNGAYNAVAGDLVPADASGGTFNINLPQAPADKTLVGVVLTTAPGAHSVTVTAQGSDVINIAGTTVNTLRVQGEARVWQYQASTGIWFSISTVPVSTLLSYIMTAANIEGTFGAKGQIYAGTGAGTGELLSGPADDSMVLTAGGADPSGLEWSYPNINTQGGNIPTANALASTCARCLASNNAQASTGSGNLMMSLVYLIKGQVIGHLMWVSGGTPATGPQHWWMVLTDTSGNMLAATADQTTTAIAANTTFVLPIATIASGASPSYTVTATGFYYIGLMVAVSTTLPTMQAPPSTISNLAHMSPALAANDSTVYTTVPAFPKQFAVSASARIFYFEAQT